MFENFGRTTADHHQLYAIIIVTSQLEPRTDFVPKSYFWIVLGVSRRSFRSIKFISYFSRVFWWVFFLSKISVFSGLAVRLFRVYFCTYIMRVQKNNALSLVEGARGVFWEQAAIFFALVSSAKQTVALPARTRRQNQNDFVRWKPNPTNSIGIRPIWIYIYLRIEWHLVRNIIRRSNKPLHRRAKFQIFSIAAKLLSHNNNNYCRQKNFKTCPTS